MTIDREDTSMPILGKRLAFPTGKEGMGWCKIQIPNNIQLKYEGRFRIINITTEQ